MSAIEAAAQPVDPDANEEVASNEVGYPSCAGVGAIAHCSSKGGADEEQEMDKEVRLELMESIVARIESISSSGSEFGRV